MTPTPAQIAEAHAALDAAPDPLADVLAEIRAEVARARAKFPGDNVTFAALVEEIGEVATATFEEPRAKVREEAIQAACMCIRLILDGDHTFDAWRKMKGLDPLVEDSP